MVALNFQTVDEPLRINHGRFLQCGNDGYVPRPKSQFLIDGKIIPRDRKVFLKIRILGGTRLPKPAGVHSLGDFALNVKVTLFDVIIDRNGSRGISKSFKTSKAVRGNSLNPIWGDDFFEYVIERKSVAMLSLEVHNNDDESIVAHSSIPISCLRNGFRSIKLFDNSNKSHGIIAFASILVQIEMYDYEKFRSKLDVLFVSQARNNF